MHERKIKTKEMPSTREWAKGTSENAKGKPYVKKKPYNKDRQNKELRERNL